MTKNDTELTREEVETLVRLQKTTKLIRLLIEKEDIDALLPNIDEKLAQYETGVITLNSGEIHVIINPARWSLAGIVGSEPENAENYEEFAYQYKVNIYNGIVKAVGFDRLMELFANALDEKFEALSTGQSQALMKKFFTRARHDGKTLSSTTRSQLQQIRDKIHKYLPLVELLGSLFVEKETYFEVNPGPSIGYRISERPSVAIQSDDLKDAINNLQGASLEEVKSSDELDKIKQAAIDKGLFEEEELPEDTYYFICHWCDFRKELQHDLSIEEQLEEHHGKPMFLRHYPDSKTDY